MYRSSDELYRCRLFIESSRETRWESQGVKLTTVDIKRHLSRKRGAEEREYEV